MSEHGLDRVPILYLAPWVDYGGTGKGTLDWFRHLDRSRYEPSLILTQHPSPNRLLSRVEPYAEELWNLPDLMPGGAMPHFILDFVHTRGIRLVHVMNSRLGFELLPDLCSLPDPPATVVQLHVEEDNRAGYVRYVTTRYANLVDGFSVTSRHLAGAIVNDYGVSPGKCTVIYTGVDGEDEFSPERVAAVGTFDDGVVHILYMGRLVDQKDPRLMLEVAERLRRTEDRFQIHVVGYGPLEDELRRQVTHRGLERFVRLEGPTDTPERWYAACDLLLLTSVFEGIPYVLFEAMAMEVPAIAPSLPGTDELLDSSCGRVVTPRDAADAYVVALTELIADASKRRRLGQEARRKVVRDFSLSRMAEEHDDLYQRLLARQTGRMRPGMVV